MWLLDSKALVLKEFFGDSTPPYAILSHTWGDEELSFREIRRLDDDAIKRKRGFAKINECCQQAQRNHLAWVWIDTVCIDKSSSAELSEAINSMYAWYRNSAICYAFLEDVTDVPSVQNQSESFQKARWFTRGWCLQELIAPRRLEFFNYQWTNIGTKRSRAAEIEEITEIDRPVFENGRVHDRCFGERLSWASRRQTSRLEDEAYCLLDILEVNMPLLYEEGNKAFLRLQRELISHTEDMSLLLWTSDYVLVPCSVLAPSPSCFQKCVTLDNVEPVVYVNWKDLLYVSDTPPGKADHPQAESYMLRRPELAQFTRKADAPAQMTSRGLQANVSVHDTTSAGAEISELHIWTRCVHNCQFICVALMANWSGIYGRRLANTVYAYTEEEFKCSFERRSIYMNASTAPNSNELHVLREQLAIISAKVSMKMACYEDGLNIKLLQCYPTDVCILNNPSTCPGSNNYLLVMDSTSGCIPMILKVEGEVNRNHFERLFHIVVELRMGLPSCVVKESLTDLVTSPQQFQKRSLTQSFPNENISDRSFLILSSGELITAKISFPNWKGSDQIYQLEITVDIGKEI